MDHHTRVNQIAHEREPTFADIRSRRDWLEGYAFGHAEAIELVARCMGPTIPGAATITRLAEALTDAVDGLHELDNQLPVAGDQDGAPDA